MKMLYDLDGSVPPKKTAVYGFQHVIFYLASSVALPVVVSAGLALSQAETSALMQRTFLMSGVFSLFQVLLAHRYPIAEGPAGLWASFILLTANAFVAAGQSLTVLRAELQTGFLIGGALIAVLAAVGFMPVLFRLFTPTVNGVLMMLMVLQISANVTRGMAGLRGATDSSAADARHVAVFFFTVVLILVLNVYAKGFVKSISAFIGVLAGWLFAIPMGLISRPIVAGNGVLSLPQPFAWGTPVFDPGIVASCVFTALVLLSMVYASINGMAELLEDRLSVRGMNRAVTFYGLGTVVSGVFPIVPMMPYVTSTGTLAMTGVAARTPFVAGAGFMLLMGLVAPVGAFFATIPAPVGYGAMTVMFAMIFRQGLRELEKAEPEKQEMMAQIAGIPMLLGVGVMFLPHTAFAALPSLAANLLSNGLIDGMILTIALEHILCPKRRRRDG